jgi:hypothetical protein
MEGNNSGISTSASKAKARAFVLRTGARLFGGGLFFITLNVVGASLLFVRTIEPTPGTLFSKRLKILTDDRQGGSIQSTLYEIRIPAGAACSAGSLCHNFFTTFTYGLLTRDKGRTRAPLEAAEEHLSVQPQDQFICTERTHERDEILLEWSSSNSRLRGSLYFDVKSLGTGYVLAHYGIIAREPQENEGRSSVWWTNSLINRLCFLMAGVGVYMNNK